MKAFHPLADCSPASALNLAGRTPLMLAAMWETQRWCNSYWNVAQACRAGWPPQDCGVVRERGGRCRTTCSYRTSNGTQWVGEESVLV